MNSLTLKAILLISFLLSGIASAQENNIQADVAISIQQAGNIWMGQQVTLDIDLKTTGFSFSDTTFNLPEVAGAFLMQIDTTTVKMTENIDGQSWQIIRYPLALFPQKPGLLEIPPITVRFSSAAGFDSDKETFEFQTRPLQLSIQAPPGIKEGTMVITTTAFKLEYDWQPDLQTETTAAKTGDAFTLTVKRSAGAISAMLLPQLPVFRVEGLAAYPQAPEVNDKTNRGDLTGERSDSIIWVAEKPGDYNIPGIRFQWWDPVSRELKQQVVPGLKLEIKTALTDKSTSVNSEQAGLRYIYFLAGLIAALLAWVLWQRFAKKLPGQTTETEKSAFSALQQACSNNQPVQAYARLNDWLQWSSATSITLAGFSLPQADTELRGQLTALQEALVSPQSNWRGSDLLTVLIRVRTQLNKQTTAESKARLLPLNP